MKINLSLLKSSFTKILVLFLISFPVLGSATQLATNAQYKKGDIVSGFQVEEAEDIKEVYGTAYTFKHLKTGAKLLFISNNDNNKVFSASFKALPEDSTGISHILEHSLLCGSEKYPLKEPFVELMKGSVKTFLNAMTFPDKTMYPVASTNDQDFTNLMDVYLDAVYFPRLYTDPLILKQEGWRYEIVDQKLKLNGVVMSEMKGAYSNPDAVINQEIMKRMFPNTVYRFDSGGDPSQISQLTQEKFVEFHKKYYHPSNSYLYLYGNGSISKQLAHIDQGYLSRFEALKELPQIQKQIGFKKPQTQTMQYSVGTNDSTKNKTIITTAWSFGDPTNGEEALAFQILNTLLIGTDASPLKRELLKAKISSTIEGYFDGGLNQPLYILAIKDTEAKHLQKYLTVVETTLKKLAQTGFDEKLIQSTINNLEFRLKENESGSTPKGLIYNYKVLESWIYGGNPTAHLKTEGYLNTIKAQIKNKYFEKLITRNLLNNTYRLNLVAVPVKGLDQKNAKQQEIQLEKLKKSMTAQQLKDIEKVQADLKKKQTTSDKAEDLEKLPVLSINDINPKAPVIDRKLLKIDQTDVLFHPQPTQDISYVQLYFNLKNLPEELIPYAELLSSLLGQLNTKNYSFSDLSNEIRLHLGGISTDISTFSNAQNMNDFKTYFVVRGKYLTPQVSHFYRLTNEIISTSNLNDLPRIKELLAEMSTALESNLQSNGSMYATTKVQAFYSKEAAFSELTSGISYIEFIKKWAKASDSELRLLVQKLEEVRMHLTSQNQLFASFTSESKNEKVNLEALTLYKAQLPETAQGQPQSWKLSFTDQQKNKEALIVNSKVQYVSMGTDFTKSDYKFNGQMVVLSNLLRKDYLWNRLRVQSGAYGAMFDISRNGNIHFTSFRDPQLSSTIKTYNETADYLKNLNLTEREVQKYIIGTMSSVDFPLSSSSQGIVDTHNYLRGLTQDDIQKTRTEILKTKLSDLKKYEQLFRKTLPQMNTFVVGSESKINENKDLFDSIKNWQ